MAYLNVSGFVRGIVARRVEDGDIAVEYFPTSGPSFALHLETAEAERVARNILDLLEQDIFEVGDEVREAHVFPDEPGKEYME